MKFLRLIFLELILPFLISGLNYNYDNDENSCPPLTQRNVKYFKRVISYGQAQPDNYVQKAILTNGKFPAEPIVVYQGDTVIVECVNYIDHNFTLHFHGLLQEGTIRSDGVPYMTQMPIFPNATYYYIINVREQLGTFIYHSHTNLDMIWVFAPFIILEKENNYGSYKQLLKNYPGYHYEEDITLIVTQLWHETASSTLDTMYQGLKAAPFRALPAAASILINGQGYGVWTQNNGNSSGIHVVYVERGKCYRIRLISAASESAIRISIKNHICKIIEADGIITNPVYTDGLNINSGQRYSCIVCMDQPVDNYWIGAKMIPGPGPKGLAILHYKGAPNPEPLRKHIAKIDETKVVDDDPFWLKGQIIPSSSIPQREIVYPLPNYVHKEFIIRPFEKTLPGGSKRFEINHIFWPKSLIPLIDLVQKNHVNITSPRTHEILVGEAIQIVFVNIVQDDGTCPQHPWHIHGHSFYIVGYGADDYRPEIEGVAIQQKINFLYNNYRPLNFPFRDVVTLFPNQTTSSAVDGTPCGWVAVRFVVNNPGIWFVQCLFTSQMIMGQQFEFYEHTYEDPFLKKQCYYNGHYQKHY